MDDMLARFLPQFITTARKRVSLALQAALARDHTAAPTAIRELHALAGEAGLLGLRDMIPLARDGEAKAKALQSATGGDDLIEALRRLERAIEHLAATAPA
jgi:HPt (histidine-containing phosphotransfer) domain-containing protein